jgi:anti-sigma factor ChrR (cupin superfamily)
VLMEDPDTGLQTVLTKMEPGSVLTDHQHVAVEQSWVLEGSLVDHEGEVTAGNYVWRPAGSRHVAHSPNGALVLGFFLKPNHFF